LWQFERANPFSRNKTPLGLEHSGGQNDFDVVMGFYSAGSKVGWQGGGC
jgi:hypothetical protein